MLVILDCTIKQQPQVIIVLFFNANFGCDPFIYNVDTVNELKGEIQLSLTCNDVNHSAFIGEVGCIGYYSSSGDVHVE